MLRARELNLGAATGFPFGNYHFIVDAGLPHIGIIPIIVGPLWFGAGYFSWVVASILLDGANRRLGRTFDFIALPLLKLARANRVATMGQLSASITHEVKQPIATARNNARAALNFWTKIRQT